MEKRPAGISIIAFLYLLFSVMTLIAGLSLATESWQGKIFPILIGIFAIAFYLGKKWAWWIISTMTLLSIIVNIPQLYYVITNSDLIPNIEKYYLKHGGKLVIQSLILFFLFSNPVYKFFSFEKLNRTKLLLILVVAVVAVFFGFKLFSYLMLATHR